MLYFAVIRGLQRHDPCASSKGKSVELTRRRQHRPHEEAGAAGIEKARV